ncbi:MAG TPA: hypothetical protein VH500_11080 [Nitrososphaeraceae archaeon]|jgi:hypothetical protein
MTGQKSFHKSGYDGKKLFASFLIVMVALVIDISISNVADIISKQAVTFWGIALFTIIAAVFVVGQYYILEIVKAKNRESKIKPLHIKTLNNTVTIIQHVLAAIMIVIVLQIVFSSHYYTYFLIAAVPISYGLAVCLMGYLAYLFFSWFKHNKSIVVLLYGLAAAAITVNAIDSIIFYDVVLLGKPAVVTASSEVIFQVGFTPGTPMFVVSTVQTYSLIGYFVLTWGGTILLLHHHIQRVGRIKFWTLVTLPLVYFMSYYITLYQTIYPTSPVTAAVSSNLALPILLYTYAIIVCGILFGLGFRSVSKSVSRGSDVRDYMIITAYGFILFFNAGDATVLQAGYPPFGLANVSFVGLSSFLIFVGLYNSAISVAQDAKLRASIKESVRKSMVKQSNLLESIGTAQMEEQIEKSVMSLTKEKEKLISQQGQIEPSLTDTEIRQYLREVIEEVKGKQD